MTLNESTTGLENNSDLQTDKSVDQIDVMTGPAWSNSCEYPSRNSNEFRVDREQAESMLKRIAEKVLSAKPLMTQVLDEDARSVESTLAFTDLDALILNLQAISELGEQALTLLSNLSTFVSCELCIDGNNEEAQKIFSEINQLTTRMRTTLKPVGLFLDRAPDKVVERYLNHPSTLPEAFRLRQSRLMRDTLLSESEETLLTTMLQHGPTAWGELYDQISGTLRCSVAQFDGTHQEMGLAQAAGLLRDASEERRRAAWVGIQTAWKTHERSAAAILNGLAGWRLETYERRSHSRKIDFLEFPVHGSRISRKTLEAMLEIVQQNIEVPRRAMRAIARGLGKSQIDPWDLLAAPPAEPGRDTRRSFRSGLRLIHDAFAGTDPSLGDFVDTMEKNRWVEGRVLPSKRQGAFCTEFAKSRTPRVYQTYMGSISDIRTLAHELGHAYHSWVMRDLARPLRAYPMTLAETASIFAETVFADHVSLTGDENAKFEIAWQNAESATSLLLNIPARFDFEKSFYEKRQTSYVSPQELSDLTDAAWTKWYGDTLSQADRQYWMTKLHFSISGVSFYNFPYTFGYLFSLGIYALKEKRGADFMPAYITILRDTGRMTAEELIKTHLGEDITKPEFWQKSLDIVAGQVAHFENLLNARQSPRLRQ